MAQQTQAELKTLVKVVSYASQLAGAASACHNLEIGSKATHLRDSAIDTGLHRNMIAPDEAAYLKSFSADIFQKTRKTFLTEPPYPCSELHKALTSLERRFLVD